MNNPYKPIEFNPFNCRNSLISDEWREFVVNQINDYRRSLARGEVLDAKNYYYPMAKDMRELKWDCNLEDLAYNKMLGNCSEIPDPPLNEHHHVMQNRSFGRNSILYTPTWTKSEICSSCKDCANYLCPTEDPHFPLNTTCPDDNLTQDSSNAALWMHNYYRKLLASGWAKDPKSTGGYAATAKQMLELEYDCASGGSNGAKETFDLIKNCSLTDPKATNGYSLNFKRIQDYTISEQDALEQMAFDKAEKVACAVKTCTVQGQTLVACQYN
ncbi:SCP-like protein, partial [Ancylostoma duodenale]